MQIIERIIGDVVVLDLLGKITLGEGDELLKDKINSLVNQGRNKVVLNLAAVPYIDSAGNGELTRSYTTVSRNGGSMVLLHPTKRIVDLLSIQKLLTCYSIFWNENDAVLNFGTAQYLEMACPVCRSTPVRCRLGDLLSRHTCVTCRSSFELAVMSSPEIGELHDVALFMLPTHEHDHVTLHFGSYNRYCIVDLPRRVDLFALGAIEKAWELAPTPRRLLLRADGVREISHAAAAGIIQLCRAHPADRTVLQVSDWTGPEVEERLRDDSLVATDPLMESQFLEDYLEGGVTQRSPTVSIKRVRHR